MGATLEGTRVRTRRLVLPEDVRIVEGHRVGLRVLGTGEPLLLLHGIGRSLEDWTDAQPALAEHFTTYAMDLEGSGRSERFTDVLTLAGLAEHVQRVLAALGETRPIRILANSMGGAVAMRLTAERPEMVRALALVGSAGFGRDAALGLRLMAVRGLAPVLLRSGPIIATLQTRAMVQDRSLLTRERVRALVAQSRRPGAIRAYLEMVHALGGLTGIREDWRRELVDALAAQRVPLLVLWGADDAVLPASHLEAAALALPYARTRLLPGLGHAPQLQAPERFVTEVLPFLLDPEG